MIRPKTRCAVFGVLGALGMCFKTGTYEPYADALKCFESGHVLIKAYRAKYGFSYRDAIRKAMKAADRTQKNRAARGAK